MTSARPVRHRVVVVRAELPGGDDDTWRIEVLEVGLHPRRDRLLGRASDGDGACRILRAWFDAVASSGDQL